MKSEHIAVRRRPDGIDVVTDDQELFDYVDDVFVNRGMVCDHVREEERDGRPLFVMIFGSNVSEASIHEVIAGLSEDAIDRIWKLNN